MIIWEAKVRREGEGEGGKERRRRKREEEERERGEGGRRDRKKGTRRDTITFNLFILAWHDDAILSQLPHLPNHEHASAEHY